MRKQTHQVHGRQLCGVGAAGLPHSKCKEGSVVNFGPLCTGRHAYCVGVGAEGARIGEVYLGGWGPAVGVGVVAKQVACRAGHWVAGRNVLGHMVLR